MPAWDLRASIESTVLAKARQYGCEIGLAFHGEIAGVPHETAVFSDGVCDSTQWAWGSVTKQFTGALLLQRVEQRRFESLDSVAHRYVDPQLSKLGLGSMATLFGLDAERITLRHLATMASGVPDYDTAKPDTPIPTDVFRAECYEAPGEVFGPAQILNLSWVARGRLDFAPGTNGSYSSTNYVLLGLALCAVQPDCDVWYDLRPGALFDALPSGQRKKYDRTSFAARASPRAAGVITGFDRTGYNGQNPHARPGVDVSAVRGVFAGLTASDLVAPAADVARFTYALYGQTGTRMLSTASRALMTPSPEQAFYGFATFNFTKMNLAGAHVGSQRTHAYGHMGATYGYDSIAAYWPAADVAVSVATNIETIDQVQPRDVVCSVLNTIFAWSDGASRPPICIYNATSYFGSACHCR